MGSRGFKKILRIDLGKTSFKDAWGLQKRLVDLRHTGRIADCLVLTEHDPVITLGRASYRSNLLCSPEELPARGIELFEIERGGDVTFHGPGQLVVYPIIDLNDRGRDLHRYLRDLENVVISTLTGLGIDAGTKEGLTGVWVGDRKLAAIGVAVSRWVTFHGLALNINTDLSYFKLINPCGITQYSVGSISSVLGRDIDFALVADMIAENFAMRFDCEMEDFKDHELIGIRRLPSGSTRGFWTVAP